MKRGQIVRVIADPNHPRIGEALGWKDGPFESSGFVFINFGAVALVLGAGRLGTTTATRCLIKGRVVHIQTHQLEAIE